MLQKIRDWWKQWRTYAALRSQWPTELEHPRYGLARAWMFDDGHVLVIPRLSGEPQQNYNVAQSAIAHGWRVTR